jgi:hypothetical protein
MVAYKDGTAVRLVSRAGKNHARRSAELGACGIGSWGRCRRMADYVIGGGRPPPESASVRYALFAPAYLFGGVNGDAVVVPHLPRRPDRPLFCTVSTRAMARFA